MFLIPLGALLDAPGLTAATYIKKSLFAAWFGNIVGGLFVAVPFTYFYLKDDASVKRMEDMEAGRTLNGSPAGSMSEMPKPANIVS